MLDFDFREQRILVTGANRGIGLAVAEAFLDAGGDVAICGLEDDTPARAKELSTRYGRPVRGFVCDVTIDAQVLSFAEDVGRCDVLVNNAGLERPTPLGAPYEDVSGMFSRILDINVAGMFRVTRALLDHMPEGARIVNTASIWGKTSVAEFSAYCASKHAVIGLTRSLALELAPRRISVNAVCPGWVETDGSMQSVRHLACGTGRSEADIIEEALQAQALSGMMKPEDMAEIYLFLASRAARNITGQSYTIDRGEILR